ncbi:hypothetical protein D3C86_1950210 [compost metagenome]
MQAGHPRIEGILLLLQVGQAIAQASRTRGKDPGRFLRKAIGGGLHARKQTGIARKDPVDISGIGLCRSTKHFVVNRQQSGLLISLDTKLSERLHLTGTAHGV